MYKKKFSKKLEKFYKAADFRADHGGPPLQ
jgi:hypothetical protein